MLTSDCNTRYSSSVRMDSYICSLVGRVGWSKIIVAVEGSLSIFWRSTFSCNSTKTSGGNFRNCDTWFEGEVGIEFLRATAGGAEGLGSEVSSTKHFLSNHAIASKISESDIR